MLCNYIWIKASLTIGKLFPVKTEVHTLCSTKFLLENHLHTLGYNYRLFILYFFSNLVSVMLAARLFGRTLLAAAKLESSTAAAATTTKVINPFEQFFEVDRTPDDDKPVVYGRGWKASELRLKSWDDLQKLWYVLLKEKNMLMTQHQMLNAQNLRRSWVQAVETTSCRNARYGCVQGSVVRKSMCRIKHVLTERAINEPDPRRSTEMKRMINAL
ncbi:hypothetical protein RND71_006317 [Anisodus tanguticus]|uniref:Large ribosomal subunit protein uL29m n=1 Tax=Anisodus tanguticus TaxID=243964 RepID=A0AAE1VW41_9SOLA|nr:hypothetical protein RND71_006317 [Anisodus tanguticus]